MWHRRKTVAIRDAGPRLSLADAEFAALELFTCFSTARLLEAVRYVPTAEFEVHPFAAVAASAELALK